MGKVSRMIRTSACFVIVALAFLAGCSSNKPVSLPYKIYSEADQLLNRDAKARPLSVVLNVYQVKDRQTFARLTFEDFVSGRSDSELFGDELLQKNELVVLPGSKQAVDMKLLPDAQFIGVVAIYRMPAEQHWRYLIPAAQIRDTNLLGIHKEITVALRLHDCFMTVDGVELDLIPGQKKGSEPVCTVPAQLSSSAEGASSTQGAASADRSDAF